MLSKRDSPVSIFIASSLSSFLNCRNYCVSSLVLVTPVSGTLKVYHKVTELTLCWRQHYADLNRWTFFFFCVFPPLSANVLATHWQSVSFYENLWVSVFVYRHNVFQCLLIVFLPLSVSIFSVTHDVLARHSQSLYESPCVYYRHTVMYLFIFVSLALCLPCFSIFSVWFSLFCRSPIQVFQALDTVIYLFNFVSLFVWPQCLNFLCVVFSNMSIACPSCRPKHLTQ